MKYDDVVNASRERSLEGVGDAEYEDYELWLGSFEGEDFKWKVIHKYNNFKEAYKEYLKFRNRQTEYTPEELGDVWHSPRIDVELRQGKKLIDWMGLYSRKVEKDLEEEEPLKK